MTSLPIAMCWMKPSTLPQMSTIEVIASRRFAKLADKTLAGNEDDVGRQLAGSVTGCCPAASSCYVMCTPFLQSK